MKKLIVVTLFFAFGSFTWAMHLEQSDLDHGKILAEAKFESLKEQATTDNSKLVIEHISVRPPEEWPFLVSRSYSHHLITPADLFFVIKHTDFMSAPDSKKAKSLFDYVILNRLKHKDIEKQRAIVLLLTELSFQRAPSWFASWNKSENYKAQINLLGSLIEEENFKAFGAILQAWPVQSIGLLSTVAVQATFYVTDENNTGYLWNGSKTENKNYSLRQWLDYKIACPGSSDTIAFQNLNQLLQSTQEVKPLVIKPKKETGPISQGQPLVIESSLEESAGIFDINWEDFANLLPWGR